MKILICDDEKEYLEILTTHVREYMDKRYIACDSRIRSWVVSGIHISISWVRDMISAFRFAAMRQSTLWKDR